MTTWTPILITPDGDVVLSKANGEYFSVLKHSSVSGTQRHSYPREEARALYAALGRWLGADEMICEAEHCHARPVSDFDGVPLPPLQAALYGKAEAHANSNAYHGYPAATTIDAAVLNRLPGHPCDETPVGDPDAKHGVSAASVLAHCLAVEQVLWGNASSFLSEQALKEHLIAWRIPASGRYADHASELARQSEGRYPVQEEVAK